MSTENMNIPTEKQIQEVLTGTSTPEIARIVAAWRVRPIWIKVWIVMP